jgi:hypothetical protein
MVANLYDIPKDTGWSKIGSGTLYQSLVEDEYTDTWATSGSIRWIAYEIVGGSHWPTIVQIRAYDTSQVPIPGTVWLFGSGLAGLAGLRKKARKTRV